MSAIDDSERSRRGSHENGEPRRAERRKSSGSRSDEDGSQKQQRRSRASGEILELLIAEFNKSSNPQSSVRKSISQRTGMSERSVRIWFQNRRAKARKIEKMARQQQEAKRDDNSPVKINDNYSFIDCRSLWVGQWQRLRAGAVNVDALTDLTKLSPRQLNNVLDSTDLAVILSKKDHELNYFFSGVFQNEKVLFRIFYPVLNILRASFIDNQTQLKDGAPQAAPTQLQIELGAPPKFAVHFLKDPTTGEENANQWSICEDFSEGQQVASAFAGEGGTAIPHILTGSLKHLQYLSTAILSYTQSVESKSSFPGPSAEPQLFEPTPLPGTYLDTETPVSDNVLSDFAPQLAGTPTTQTATLQKMQEMGRLDLSKMESPGIDMGLMLGTETEELPKHDFDSEFFVDQEWEAPI